MGGVSLVSLKVGPKGLCPGTGEPPWRGRVPGAHWQSLSVGNPGELRPVFLLCQGPHCHQPGVCNWKEALS